MDHRWMMYSVFIGLTLGGVPVIWKLIERSTKGVWGGAVVGFALMAALAIVQQQELGTAGAGASGVFMLGVAGIAVPGATRRIATDDDTVLVHLEKGLAHDATIAR